MMIGTDRILFFPVTPFGADGGVAHDVLRTHVVERLPFEPGAVFPACGTGEYHALSADEVAAVVRTTVDAVAGAVPVVAGAGGPLGHAVRAARGAAEAGADALLVLPPYLVSPTQAGLAGYVRAIADASGLPVILYGRATARYAPATVAELAADPRVVGYKDGIGDLALAQEIVRAVAGAGRDDFLFFNGLLTAELTQTAYRGVGIPRYSSAAFAMAPEIARAYLDAYLAGDEERRGRLLDGFFRPLVALRDESPGFAVALIKAGLAESGLAVGGVRPPLSDPDAEQRARLAALLAEGRALAAAP
jgi:5-dehydro-4-deoxyglucarate dehydratase